MINEFCGIFSCCCGSQDQYENSENFKNKLEKELELAGAKLTQEQRDRADLLVNNVMEPILIQNLTG
ncbi:MAG: hypothetical protein H0V82_08875 [Candidatus Protochlamydia sp.]|nr:hypothetical protein [Candidatus Protochlamydia sp.]